MLIRDLVEGRTADLFHATKIKYYEEQLKGDFITASVIHRWWKNGLRHERPYNNLPNRPTEEIWKDHVWIKGISLSRSFDFCAKWGPIVYTLDQQAIANRYKLLPLKWSNSRVVRSEYEEFLWMDTSDISGDGPEPIRYAEDGKIKLTNLHKYLKEITFIKKYTHDLDNLDKIKDNVDQYAKKYGIKVSEK